MPPKGVLEIPLCPGAVDGVQKIFANPVGLYGIREILYDHPLVNLELRGKLLKAVGRNASLDNFPLVFLPCRKTRLLVVAGLLCLTQKNMGDGFHLAAIRIQEGGGLVELQLQGLNDIVEANSRRHRFETIILPSAPTVARHVQKPPRERRTPLTPGYDDHGCRQVGLLETGRTA
jgi:hypothetical protein